MRSCLEEELVSALQDTIGNITGGLLELDALMYQLLCCTSRYM